MSRHYPAGYQSERFVDVPSCVIRVVGDVSPLHLRHRPPAQENDSATGELEKGVEQSDASISAEESGRSYSPTPYKE